MASEELAADYTFDLPAELIAQHPAPQRDQSRLMVVGRDRIDHRTFSDLPQCFRAGDLLVLNDTRVIAARVHGTREGSGGAVELLLLGPAQGRYDPNATRWNALARPAKRLRAGDAIAFGEFGRATVVAAGEEGLREIELDLRVPFETFLERAGRLPLPPYIRSDDDADQQRYQTIFARVPGSVAAPTASLHFTEHVLKAIRARGVDIAYVTLDVGLGTFRPMKSARLSEHVMHAERYDIPQATIDAVARTRERGGRVVAAGTTVVRTLEGCVHDRGALHAGERSTRLFITPGFPFAAIDAMVTNFHLPHSTLLVLVSAFAGRERVLSAYRTAVHEKYRFFSFGDAMWLERATLH
jgi:S-adenosylmethionine:tRNA ribosyltransferase-isomerase